METRLRRLVKENTIRSNLTYFYDAVLSKKNAQIFSYLKPEMNIKGEGNPTHIRGFDQFVEWIDEMHGFAKNEVIFEDNILKPFRLASACHINTVGSLNVKGLIFSKSERYFDPAWNMWQRTISIISSDLQAPFSIRIKDTEASELSYGLYEFRHVKPVLLTNRIHKYGGSEIKKLNSDDEFEKWDFLSSTIQDLDHFDCTIETEHYCEMPIYNDPRKRLLGATLTISGQVVFASGPIITIKSVTSGMESQFQISGKLQNTNVERFEGEYIKALVARWYHETPYDASTHRESDLFILKKITKEEAVIHDVVGHVRVRKTESIEELKKTFGNDMEFEKIPSMEIQKACASIRDTAKQEDPKINEYLSTMKQIRFLRASSPTIGGPLHTPEDVFDPKKISDKYLAKDGHIVIILTNMIQACDFGMPVKMDLGTSDRILKRKQNLLIELGHIKNTDGMTVTYSGIEIAYESHKITISSIMEGKNTVLIPDLEDKMTPTLLYRYLEKNGYSMINYKGTRFDLIWEKVIASDTTNHEEGIERMCNPILKAMARKTHSLHFDAIMKTVRDDGKAGFSVYSLERIMNFLVNRRIISRDGESYRISTERRILLFLKENKNSAFSLKDIHKNVRIPRDHRSNQPAGISDKGKMNEIQASLSNLKKQNEVEEIISGHWQAYADPATLEERRGKEIELIIRRTILSALKSKSMQKQVLIDRLDHHFRTNYKRNEWRYKPRELLEKSLLQLLNEGHLREENGKIELAGSS